MRLAVVLSCCLAAAVAEPALAARPLAPPAPAGAVAAPPPLARDTVVAGPRAAAAALPAEDAPTVAVTGETVRLRVSRAYSTDPARNRAWADFFAALPHGAELGSLTVHFAPASELAALCGADANACYAPVVRTMVLSGDGRNPDGSTVEDSARHEYGHHLALASWNPPWAPELGTPRWFTHERICARLASGELVADPAADYARSPVEGFAEAYRVAAGGAERWGIVADVFRPAPGAIAAILADARTPVRAAAHRVIRGRLGRRGVRAIEVAVPLDGPVRAHVRAAAGLDADVELLDAGTGRALARGWRRGSRDRAAHVACGVRRVVVRLRAARGSGRYRLALRTPG